MFNVAPCPIPNTTFLEDLTHREGNYTDCFVTDISEGVSISEFISAFFGSPVLRLERRLLALISAKSTAADVAAVANGTGTKIALWTVDQRDDTQIILKAASGGIRTWMMVSRTSEETTRLYFGSALVPEASENGEIKLRFSTRALMGFHKLYSRIVLWSARKQLHKMRR